MKDVFNAQIKNLPIIELVDIKKNFDNVIALKGVYLRAFGGKAMGVLGENGAGKSTLMNILSGVLPSSSGSLNWNGLRQNNFKNVKEAEKLGISIIHQEINCFNDMNVLDNIFAGHEISKFGVINYSYQRKIVKKFLKDLNLNINLNLPISQLTIADQQMIEITKALLRKSKVIIFDEPTSSLSNSEAKTLFKIIDKLKKEDIAILYISHKLEEIPIVCDYITILRDGNFIGEYIVNEISEEEMISKMVGREIIEKFPHKENTKLKEEIFKVENLSSDHLIDINFSLYRNEILGFSGLIGAQRTELFKTIIGYFPKNTGRMTLFKNKVNFKNINAAIKKGFFYVTEDRKNDGLVLFESIRKNISLSFLKGISKLNFINLKLEKKLIKQFINSMSIKTNSEENLVESMSGGNQQKVLLAKAFVARPKIMVFDEPTRGVDVGSRREIYDLIYEAKRNGIGVIVISSDLPEIVGLCNRVIVMKSGKITKTICENITPEEIMKHAI